MGITALSKSQVSRDGKEPRRRRCGVQGTDRLDQGPYRFVWADALVVKVRESGRSRRLHVLSRDGRQQRGPPGGPGCRKRDLRGEAPGGSPSSAPSSPVA